MNLYPALLHPNSFELINFPSNQLLEIPKVNVLFEKWNGSSFSDTYNSKAVLDFNGEPVFAEIAILIIFQSEGWN
jgi:hypothetical protein